MRLRVNIKGDYLGELRQGPETNAAQDHLVEVQTNTSKSYTKRL
jgi:hypothetical protein